MKQINEQFSTERGLTANGQIVTSLYQTKWLCNNILNDLDEPKHIKDWYFTPNVNDTAVTDAEILKEIILNDWSRWNTELKPGEPIEVSESVYFNMLECLPPKNWNGTYFEVGEPHHHDNKGKPIHRAFWQDGDKYFTGYPKN